MKVIIDQQIPEGSVMETMTQSWKYFISTEDANKVGKLAGEFADHVCSTKGGYFFYLTCATWEAIELCKEHGIELEII